MTSFLMPLVCCSWLSLLHHLDAASNTFALGNTQGDYMVLQQSPWRAKVWGTSPTANSTVTLELALQETGQLIERITTTSDADGVWRSLLNPREASREEYTISATSATGAHSATLKHVLFGDVYVCSGQSNMQVDE